MGIISSSFGNGKQVLNSTIICEYLKGIKIKKIIYYSSNVNLMPNSLSEDFLNNENYINKNWNWANTSKYNQTKTERHWIFFYLCELFLLDSKQTLHHWKHQFHRVKALQKIEASSIYLYKHVQQSHSTDQNSSILSDCGHGQRGTEQEPNEHQIGRALLKC